MLASLLGKTVSRISVRRTLSDMLSRQEQRVFFPESMKVAGPYSLRQIPVRDNKRRIFFFSSLFD